MSDEKDRLMKEVLGKPRPYEKEENKSSSFSHEPLKQADQSFQSLQAILNKQKKDLDTIEQQRQKANEDMLQFQKELADEYDLKEDVNPDVSKDIFVKIETECKNVILGQDDAIHALCMAFRRPFVMRTTSENVYNVILMQGPVGTKRHEALEFIAKRLKEEKVFESKKIFEMDLSQYQSAAQESIFLQDLYQAFTSSGKIVTFENFESGFGPFLRMIDELVLTGELTLNKRYVLKQGILVENQTGLVKQAVDKISVNGKYLVFFTKGGLKDIQNAFGSEFLSHVFDVVTFHPLSLDIFSTYCKQYADAFVNKCQQQLHVRVEYGNDFLVYLTSSLGKGQGVVAIEDAFQSYYVEISNLVLEDEISALRLFVQEEKLYVEYDGVTKVFMTKKTKQEELDEIEAELKEIIGLQEVKDYIHSIQSHMQIQALRSQQGLKTSSLSYHMIFTGNPGTGKTTIARLLARYMKAIGALSQGQLVEVTRKDLVAQYVGQTAPLTMSVVKSALGGVLFIDEAYALHRGNEDHFGLECIDTLVKAMEDYRDNLVVILAGYEEEMEEFLSSNSGLKSRFPNVMHFEDFTGQELLEITLLQAKKKGYQLEEAACVKLLEYYDEVQKSHAKEAGNGRLARNVLEAAILEQAKRLLKQTDQDLSLLKEEDFILESLN